MSAGGGAPPRRVLTTGIGSLPFHHFGEALDHVWARYDVPFYPQLARAGDAVPLMLREVLPRPERGEKLLAQLAGEPGLDGFAGFGAFCARARGLVKMQLAGPLTLAAWLAAENPALAADRLRAACWAWIERLTAKLAAQLPAGAWLVWDDALLGRAADGERFAALRRSLPVRLGLHSCLDGDARPLLERYRGAVLALDASVLSFAGAADALAAHAAAGGLVVFGVFDTRARALDVGAGLARARQALGWGGGDVGFSGGCGTGLHTVAFELQLATALAKARALA